MLPVNALPGLPCSKSVELKCAAWLAPISVAKVPYDANETLHLNPDGLEMGNPAKLPRAK